MCEAVEETEQFGRATILIPSSPPSALMICSQAFPAGEIARFNPLPLAKAEKTFFGLGALKNLRLENLAVVTIPSCDNQTSASAKSWMMPVSSPIAQGITAAPPGTYSSPFAHACCEEAYRSSCRNFGIAVDTCKPEPMRRKSTLVLLSVTVCRST